MLLVGTFVFGAAGADGISGLAALGIMVLATAFAAMGIAMALASLVTTERQVDTVSTLVILMMSALGGSWMPIFIMPDWMQVVARGTVNFWAIEGFHNVTVKNGGVETVLVDAFALSCWGAAGLVVAFLSFKKHSRS
jgi:ABC-2 type transport system permease protein